MPAGPKRYPTLTLRQVANELTQLAMDADEVEISNRTYELALELYALIGLTSGESASDGVPLGSGQLD